MADLLNLTLNSLSEEQRFEALLRCCGSTTWVQKMMTHYPYSSMEQIHQRAISCWKEVGKEDILEAFRAHPMIGADLDSLRKKFKKTSNWSEGEQAGIQDASEQTIVALQKANLDYVERFGYIFIVCATGKSAAEMLGLLEGRLSNSTEEEIWIAAAEQQKITAIRLEKLAMTQPTAKKSPITTHILDTHRGCPAAGVSIELKFFDGSQFVSLAQGVTNDDGRIVGLLAGKELQTGMYQMHFDTKGYHDSLGIEGFYPEVLVTFDIKNTNQHYHIPLLLSPFGYSTYRGS